MKLYETITAENWCQGRYWLRGWENGSPREDFDAGGCLKWQITHSPRLSMDDRWRLYSVIALLFPERVSGRVGPPVVVAFNDHPDTTLDDVLRVCKLADV